MTDHLQKYQETAKRETLHLIQETNRIADDPTAKNYHFTEARLAAHRALTAAAIEMAIGVLEGLKSPGLHGWWHELSCPAHSNQMQPESECNCVYGAVHEDIDQTIATLEQAKGEK